MAENLQIKLIDLQSLDNAQKHQTNKFEIVHAENPISVLRRGQIFSIKIHFENRNFQPEDSVRLIFSYGENPNAIQGTKAVLSLKNSLEDLNDSLYWALNIVDAYDEEDNIYITVDVISPADCLVGIWNLKIETSDLNLSKESTVYEYDSQIYLLFNPWCSGDQVFMPDSSNLDEYILNDCGTIWKGPRESLRGRDWIFGQFDKCVLPACMLMFSRSSLSDESRGDAVKTTRTISKMVNSDDDKGILIARWDGEYSDGIPPAAWTGSVDILRQFLNTSAPVSYGQCWVFAGVVTTICRALGIPSRVVTNLVSAQDTNESLTIDKIYDENNEEINFDDCIWNFHAWNDVWMARPDLKPKIYNNNLPTCDCNKALNFDGWQAINATPTEKSHGFFQCGPAPLEAIKKGIVGVNFDVGFMLASVNADIIRWKEDPSCFSGYSKINCNKYQYELISMNYTFSTQFSIGRLILTTSVHGTSKQNITYDYKAKEGTLANRDAYENAIRRKYSDVPDGAIKDMTFSLEDIKSIEIGQPFTITVHITNNHDDKRNLEFALSARSVFYNGKRGNEITKKFHSFTVLPAVTLEAEVQPEIYIDKLVEYGIIKVHAICTDIETKTMWADEDDFQVTKKSIQIKIPDDSEINKDEDVTVFLVLTNPLKYKLTNCKFYLAGLGLWKNITIETEDIEPEEKVEKEVTIVPKLAGTKKLIATFASTELVDITGSTEIYVNEI